MDNSKTYILALDLKNDESLISEYEHHHKPGNVWPEIIEGIKACGIQNMKIYRLGNRLVMVLQTDPDFDLTRDFARMSTLPRQQEWAALMLRFQERIPFAGSDEHWGLMSQIFDLNA
ncbi:MAG TPA: L-rhamnose mutarotase [Chitinophagaceae bacterium]|nr:L-rhamnose mutarotase [Chitinophagaceae bacterium]